MLLRHRLADPRKRMAVGQLCLVLGILLSRFGPRWAPNDLGQGIVAGASGVLLGLSIVLMLTGLRMRRREGGGGEE